MGINFVTAKNGKIRLIDTEMGIDDNKTAVIVSSADVEELANAMCGYGLADEVYHSSSMDFASEDGFENDGDAWVIFDEALKQYNWVANGIAG